MSIAQKLLAELNYEASNTRKVLERLPDEHFDWKPHVKSYSLGQLATHIANLPSWLTIALSTDEFDLAAGGFARTDDKTFKDVMNRFESKIKAATEALEIASDEKLKSTWILKKGGVKILELPRVGVIRSMVMNHTIHHRGEMIVYMRLLNLKVPGLYGPSADEQ